MNIFQNSNWESNPKENTGYSSCLLFAFQSDTQKFAQMLPLLMLIKIGVTPFIAAQQKTWPGLKPWIFMFQLLTGEQALEVSALSMGSELK